MSSTIKVAFPCILISYTAPKIFVPAENTGPNTEQVALQVTTNIPTTGRRPFYRATGSSPIPPHYTPPMGSSGPISGIAVTWNPPNPPPVSSFTHSGTVTDEHSNVVEIPPGTFVV